MASVHWEVFKLICSVVYNDMVLVYKWMRIPLLWIAAFHHREVIQVIGSIVVALLEMHIHTSPIQH